MSLFKGSGVAIVTPFNESGVNYEEFEKLINWQIEMGTDSIIVCGTTGEASTMSEEERKGAISYAIKTVNKRVPVIAGTGSNSTKNAISMSIWAEEAGADGLLVITPYYNKTTQKGLVEHFTAIASKVKTPIIIYNVPSRTGLNILPATLEKLCTIPNITAVKEASSNINQIAEIKRLCKDNLDIYSGNDSEIIPILALGGAGVISVLANIAPKATHDICALFFQGMLKEALDLQLKTLPLINALFIETNPIPVKTAMNLMGMNAGKLRLPLCEMESKNLAVLKKQLTDYNLL
ncbi:MAG: 4-hydroxy-tetrahydrodipicolinate synthase [Clostridiaceae bacterium]